MFVNNVKCCCSQPFCYMVSSHRGPVKQFVVFMTHGARCRTVYTYLPVHTKSIHGTVLDAGNVLGLAVTLCSRPIVAMGSV